MKSKLLSGAVILIFLLSMTATPQAQTANFSLKLIYPADVQYYDSLGQTIKQQFSPLLVNVETQGLLRSNYLTDFSDFDYDLALYSITEVSTEFPPLWSLYSPDSFAGNDIYRTNDTFALVNYGVPNTEEFFSLLDDYKNASLVTAKQSLAKEIQTIYNQDWLLDVPLVSTADIIASWPEFGNFDHQEGLINSLFLGANWTENPEERAGQGRTVDEIHYEIENFLKFRNPLFYQGRDGYLSAKPVFSTVFLKDGENGLHPNLAQSFEHTVNEDGTANWTLHLRDDVKWSDDEPLTAEDIKFTYDMVSFDWIGATNHQDWTDLLSVEIVNATTVELQFANDAITNQYDLADQFIVPEHILNQSYTIDGIEYHPYTESNPAVSDIWQNFEANPVTAGPYDYNSNRSRVGVIEVYEKNLDYWTPSIADTPEQIFNLTAGAVQDPYYFDGIDEVALETLVYHVTDSQKDPNTQITKFTTGVRDIIEFDTLDTTSNIFEGEEYRLDILGDAGGLVMIFNPDKKELRNPDIRRALTQAVDREELVSLMGQGQLPQGTSVSKYFPDYYESSVEIGHDFQAARDTFLRNGFDAIDNNTAQDFEWPWERAELPLPVLPMLASFAMLAVVRIIAKRK